MKTYNEQIADLENTRAAKMAAMDTLAAKAAGEGRSMDIEEGDEFDALTGEVKSLDKDLVRLRSLETLNVERAVPVAEVRSAEEGATVRTGGSIQVKSNQPKGTAFTRYVIALARSHGNLVQAAELSKRWDDTTPEVSQVLRAAVSAGTTTDPQWAAPLVQYQTMASEFIELLRPQTILGRINGLRHIPFNVKVAGVTSGSSVGWVGEGKAKPVSQMAFGSRTLARYKAAGIVVLTDELVRESSPSAEAAVRSDLTAAMAQFLDQQFVDPAVAGTPGVSPASITNGITPVASSGTDLMALHTDLKAAIGKFIAAKIPLSSGTWIMNPSTAMAISMMRNPLGQVEFGQISMNGGTFLGMPVVVSESAGDQIVLLVPNEIYLADNGEVLIDASREASLEMDTEPGSDGAATLVSLWQQNMVGIRAERFVNWARRRNDAVAVITGANYA